jgi:hypothetical protein
MDYVGQRLLYEAEQSGLDLRGEGLILDLFELLRHLDHPRRGHGLVEVLHRRHQAEVIQDGRSQVVGQGADGVYDLLRQMDEVGYLTGIFGA